jgi:hypothetical protein
MTTDQLKECLARRPFVPLTIRQADGRETRITHPEAMGYAGGRIATYVHPDDRAEIIDLLLVSSLLVDSPNGGGAGGVKRRPKGR